MSRKYIIPTRGDETVFWKFIQRWPNSSQHALSFGGETLRCELVVAHAKKILRVSQIKMLQTKFRSSRKNHISYDSKFVNISMEGCSNRDQGLDLVKALNDFVSLIVLRNIFSSKLNKLAHLFTLIALYSYTTLRNSFFYSYHFGSYKIEMLGNWSFYWVFIRIWFISSKIDQNLMDSLVFCDFFSP